MAIPQRYLMTGLLLLVNIFCYMDRTNIGIVIGEFGYTQAMNGFILSAFFYGYIATQMLGGYGTQRIGAKATLLVGILVWTAGDVTTIAAATIPAFLIACRVIMGLGEGVNYPCVHHFASVWFPKEEKSFLTSIVSSGMDLGTIFSFLVAPRIIKTLGWQYVFVVAGALNIFWAIAFFFLGSNDPESSKRISPEEKDIITAEKKHSVVDQHHAATPWKGLLTKPAFLAIYTSHFCMNYAWYVLLSWIPTYFKHELGINLKQNPILGALPYMCGFVGSIVAGRVSDFLIKKAPFGMKPVHTRKLFNSLGQFLPGVFLFLVTSMKSTAGALVLLCLVMVFGRMVMCGYWVNMLDVAPDYAGQVMGISNTIATIPGILGNTITGVILDKTDSWFLVFAIAACINFIGGIVFLIFAQGEPQEFTKPVPGCDHVKLAGHSSQQPSVNQELPEVPSAPNQSV